MQPDSLKLEIQTLARCRGFVRCSVTRPELKDLHARALDAWLDADMQGEMRWMGEQSRVERRKHPESMLDQVKSVISLALPYSPPAYALDEASNAVNQGVITAYAHGDDYHEAMKKRLKTFASELDMLLGKHDQRVFVDTAPVLEHALAESAGLGWQGKHSLTIDRELGSWFLLGEIFTTAEIEPDHGASNHCGSCSACIDICPTRAIVAPYVVDARLCISYLTIEFDAFIPTELRPLMGNRIYGCDDCQLICPWNRHVRAPDDDLLKPRGENVLPDLASLLQLDEVGFRERFRKSPIRRTKRRGLLRNVCIAMGNSGCRDFIPELTAVLDDEEAVIRGHAVWALARLADSGNSGEISAALGRLQAVEQDMHVHEEIRHAIASIKELI